MSFKKGNYHSKKVSKSVHENIKLAKKDVVERLIRILWKKEVDFNFSTK